MEISREFHKEIGDMHTVLSWKVKAKSVSIRLPGDASAIYSEVIDRVVVEIYPDKKIYIYDSLGNYLCEYSIVDKEGYQFRGLNRNKKSKSGIALLYHPLRAGLGNEWNDTEQYEFILDELRPVGKKLDIYR